MFKTLKNLLPSTPLSAVAAPEDIRKTEKLKFAGGEVPLAWAQMRDPETGKGTDEFGPELIAPVFQEKLIKDATGRTWGVEKDGALRIDADQRVVMAMSSHELRKRYVGYTFGGGDVSQDAASRGLINEDLAAHPGEGAGPVRKVEIDKDPASGDKPMRIGGDIDWHSQGRWIQDARFERDKRGALMRSEPLKAIAMRKDVVVPTSNGETLAVEAGGALALDFVMGEMKAISKESFERDFLQLEVSGVMGLETARRMSRRVMQPRLSDARAEDRRARQMRLAEDRYERRLAEQKGAIPQGREELTDRLMAKASEMMESRAKPGKARKETVIGE